MRVRVIVAAAVVCTASVARAEEAVRPQCTLDDCFGVAERSGDDALVDLDAIVPVTMSSRKLSVVRADSDLRARIVRCPDGRVRCVRLTVDQAWILRAGTLERRVQITSVDRLMRTLAERAAAPALSSLEQQVLDLASFERVSLGDVTTIVAPDAQEPPRPVEPRVSTAPAAPHGRTALPATPAQTRAAGEAATSRPINIKITNPDEEPPPVAVDRRRASPSRTLVSDSFADVVLVGDDTLRCSGVVISRRVVLTAAHCLPATRVVFAARADDPVATLAVEHAVAHPDGVDAALLLLDVDSPWAPTATRMATDAAPPRTALTLVGFGIDDARLGSGFGVKRRVSVLVNGWGCDGRRAEQTGCDPITDLVIAGQFGRDTCDGDSGGPVFEWTGRTWRLVAITSRPILPGLSSCGRGGIYTRVDRLMRWAAPYLEAP